MRLPVTATMVISTTSGAGLAVSTRSTLGWCPPLKSGISRCRWMAPRLESHGISCLTGRAPASPSTSRTANWRGSAGPWSGVSGWA
jgi:hypothetical protein